MEVKKLFNIVIILLLCLSIGFNYYNYKKISELQAHITAYEFVHEDDNNIDYAAEIQKLKSSLSLQSFELNKLEDKIKHIEYNY